MSETIDALEVQARQFQSEISEAKALAATLARRIQFQMGLLQLSKFAVKSRGLIDRTIVWRPGVVLILATIAGGVGLAVLKSPIVGIVTSLFAIAASTWFLIYPADTALSRKIAETEVSLPALILSREEATNRNSRLSSSWDAVTKQLAAARIAQKNAELAASATHRRGLLLAENWRALRSVEFEQFLERVFLELGYAVETTKVTGDQGVDLVVSHQGKRIAIQVKGYFDSVSNGAIQEAHTGMAYYKCHGCAVITNSRFTRNAIDLADNVGCVLISEGSLPGLVRGEVDLWQLCFATAARQQQ